MPVSTTTRPPQGPGVAPAGRRRRAQLLAVLLAAATGAAALGGCSPATAGPAPAPASDALTADLPTDVPAGTRLVIGDPTTQKAFELAGDAIDSDFSFEVEWANISGGPQTTEAFRGGSLDVGAVAEIPPVHATWTGLDVRIIASVFREDWQGSPIYEFGVAPGVEGVEELEDFRGKRIAYSPGQAQGALVLKALAKAGLTPDDVELVELPSTGDVYPTALAGREVDIAPLGGTSLPRYLSAYGKDGAHAVTHGIRDDASHLYVPVTTLADPAKAAALREYVQAWGQAREWIYAHPEEWRAGYYIEDQGLSEEDADYLIEHASAPDIPADWTEAIERHQETIDLLAEATGNEVLDAGDLYDERFAPVIADAVEAYDPEAAR